MLDHRLVDSISETIANALLVGYVKNDRIEWSVDGLFEHSKWKIRKGTVVDEIERGEHTLWMDVECPHCGKEQSLAQTNYVGGPCCRCGIRTDGKPECNQCGDTGRSYPTLENPDGVVCDCMLNKE